MTQDLRAAAQAVVSVRDSDIWGRATALNALERALAAPSEPDVLPGLKRALEKLRPCLGLADGRVAIRAEIARIEKERQS